MYYLPSWDDLKNVIPTFLVDVTERRLVRGSIAIQNIANEKKEKTWLQYRYVTISHVWVITWLDDHNGGRNKFIMAIASTSDILCDVNDFMKR